MCRRKLPMPELDEGERAKNAAYEDWRKVISLVSQVSDLPMSRLGFEAGFLAGRDYARGEGRETDDAIHIAVDHERRTVCGQIEAADQRVRELTEALLMARADILGVNGAGFDSTRGEVALRGIQRIDAALSLNAENPGDTP